MTPVRKINIFLNIGIYASPAVLVCLPVHSQAVYGVGVPDPWIIIPGSKEFVIYIGEN